MTRAIRFAGGLVAALALTTPGFAQQAPTSTQPGPSGSSPGPVAPQLQAIQEALLNADRQLSGTVQGGQPPNYDQTLRAVMGAQDTVAELRQANGGRETDTMRLANRHLAETRQALERPNPDRNQVSEHLRLAINAVNGLNSNNPAATGAAEGNSGSPSGSGGAPR